VPPTGAFWAPSAPLDLSYFEPLLTDARLGPGSAAAIRRVDTGTLIVRQPAVPADADRASTDHPAHRLILAGQATGSSRHLSELDGIERIISFQRLEHFPLYTVVGIARDTALGDWWRRSLASAALVAAALLSVVLFYRHMARSKRLLESVLEAASEVAIIATDRNGRVTLFNRGAENLLGHPAADAVGRMGLADLHPGATAPAQPGAHRQLGRPPTGFEALTAIADRQVPSGATAPTAVPTAAACRSRRSSPRSAAPGGPATCASPRTSTSRNAPRASRPPRTASSR
jgi:PAS domain-containing protein